MRAANERFRAACEPLGFQPEIVNYPEGARTAPDAAAAVGCELGQIVKSLVFVGDGQPILALTSGSNRVDTEALGRALGVAEVGRADADAVRDATGFAIGGTPPFGHAGELRTAIDRDLLAHETVYAAGGTPDSCFPIAPDRLVELSGGIVADFAQR